MSILILTRACAVKRPAGGQGAGRGRAHWHTPALLLKRDAATQQLASCPAPS